MGTPYAKYTLKEDGIAGPKTKGAINLVKKTVGELDIALFDDAMEKLRAESIPPSPPAPPPPQFANPETAALQIFKRRFGRLPLNRVPDLVKIIKQWGREEFGSARKFWSEPRATEEAEKKLQEKINSITREDVKQYIM